MRLGRGGRLNFNRGERKKPEERVHSTILFSLPPLRAITVLSLFFVFDALTHSPAPQTMVDILPRMVRHLLHTQHDLRQLQ